MKNGLPNIVEGMHISMLLERMPKSTFIVKPTVRKDANWEGKLVITYHYSTLDVVLAWAEATNDDGSIFMQGYFVQEIWEVENVEKS